jgi:hypothetical protein
MPYRIQSKPTPNCVGALVHDGERWGWEIFIFPGDKSRQSIASIVPSRNDPITREAADKEMKMVAKWLGLALEGEVSQ